MKSRLLNHVKFIVGLLLLAPGTVSHGQQPSEEVKNAVTVTLESFIERSCAAYPEFKKILMDNLYLQYSEDTALSPDDYTIEADLGYYYRPDSERSGAGSTIDISKLFPQTGTSASAGWSLEPGAEEASSSLSLGIRQDIARNAFGKMNSLEGIKISSRKSLSGYQTTEAYEDLLAVLIQEYYGWITARENLRTARSSYAESLRLLENTGEKRASMIASQLDVNRMELTVLGRRENLLETEAASERALRKIRDYMKDKSGAMIEPEDISVNVDLSPGFENLFREIETRSRTFRILDELEKEGLTSIEIKKRELFPSASLFASYSHSGTGYVPGSEPERSLSFGLSLSQSFPRKREKAELETLRLDYDKTLLENGINRENLRLQLENLYSEIMDTETLIGIYSEKLKVALLILEDEKRNFNIGKSGMKDYIEAINSSDSIEYEIRALKAELNVKKTEWLRLTDNLAGSSYEDLLK